MEAALPCQPARPRLFFASSGNPENGDKNRRKRTPRGILHVRLGESIERRKMLRGTPNVKTPCRASDHPPLDPRNGCSGRPFQGVRSAVPGAPSRLQRGCAVVGER